MRHPSKLLVKKFENRPVMDVVEDTLARYSNIVPLNIFEALVSAAIDESVHRDCVYFLIKRQPETVINFITSGIEIRS